MGAIDRLLHRDRTAQFASDAAPAQTSGSTRGGLAGMVYRPRIRRLEDRLLLSAVPEAAVVDLPDQELINEDFNFTVTFDNTGSEPDGTGYGPFVDVTVGPGIDINGVTYLGTPVTSQTVGTWDGTQWVDGSGNPITEHPLDPSLEMPDGTEVGQTWVNVLAPFGSYTPDQPAIELEFSATVSEPDAVVGEPIDVTARGGFQYGLDSLNNPSIDPPLQQGSTSSDTLTPIVMKLEKSVQLPESETAQGPNYQFTYTISIDIATGATVEDINIQDLLPDNLYFLTATTNVGADTVIAPGVGGTAQGIPGLDTVTTAQWTFASVTGQAGGGDIVITLTAYAPETDADGNLLIDPDNPTATIATNDATVDAEYNGQAVDSTTGGALEDSVDIIIRPYTVLKTVSVEGGGNPIPGSYLRYQIDIDVSDYQSFQDLVITDVLSDGLTLDTAAALDHTPVLRIERDGEVFLIDLRQFVLPGDETELTADVQADYTQELQFFISAALRNAGYDDAMIGDLLDGVQNGATQMTLVFYARIDETFRNPDRGEVVVTDAVSNEVSMAANSNTSGNASQPDGSQVDVDVPNPQSQKTVYAINGEVDAGNTIAPGDEVTYRIRVYVDVSKVNNLRVTDYLPLPVYDVDGNGTGFTFVDSQGGVPAAYTIVRGPDDTLSGATGVAGVPTVVTDGAGNAIIITFSNFAEEGGQSGVIDLLYTVVATDQPFADGLLLVNQARVQTGNSLTDISYDESFVGEVILRQPVLSLTKGAVATDADGAVDGSLGFDPTAVAPGKMTFEVGTDGFTTTSPVTADDLASTPITSDMSGFDGGDTVKFAIVVQNTGGQDAFDVVIRDTLPPGFEIPPGAVLTVQYGDGTAVDFTGDINDFFGAGITLNDDDANGLGAVAAGGDANGHDIIIVSYELVAADDINPGITVENGAELVSFASIENGNDFTEGVEGQFTDEAELTAQGVRIDKRLIETSQDFTTGNDLTIGETGTFQIEVTMPDGATEATVTDVLPQGMVLVGDPIIRLTFTNAEGDTVTFDGAVEQGGVTLSDGSTLAFTQNGNTLTFDFSDIITDAAPGTDLSGQSFVIEYVAVTTDDAALSAGVTATNTATLDTPTTDPTSDTATVDIVEPDLTVTKSFQPDTAQAGQTVQMQIAVRNASGTFSSTSFGLNLEDVDPDLSTAVFSDAVLVSVTGTGGVASQVGTVSVTVQQVGGQWQINVTAPEDFAIAPGERLVLTFNMTIDPNVETGTVVENTATIVEDGYSSLPGVDPNEREYGPEDGSDTLTISSPTITKTIVNTSYGGTEQLSPGDPGYVADPDDDVLVGEIVTYQVNVRIPRGISNDVIVYDDTNFVTAAGTVGIMEIVGVDSIVVGGSIVSATSPAITFVDTNGDGVANQLQIDFGALTNGATGSVDVAAESIVIIFRAQILDVPETNDGDVHTNGTAVTFTVGGEPNFNAADTFPTVTVHEPDIEVVKTATTPDSTTDAGDIVTYTLTIRHTGSSSADGFSLDLTDVLDPNMELIAGSATIDTSTVAFGLDPLVPGDVILDTDNNQVLVSGFDLGLNQVVTITYQARVADTVVSGEELTNDVTLTYQSLPEEDPVDDVDPSTALPGTIAGDGGESERRPYEDETSATVVIAVPGPITKTTDKTNYTIGEVINYTILVPVIEGQTVDPVLTDVLPEGQMFIAGSGQIFAADGTVLTGTFTQSGQTLTLDGDTFITVPDNDESNDYIRITFQARVLNIDDNNNGDIKTNEVTFTSDDQPDREAEANVTIVEPDIVLSKSNDAAGPVDAGDIVTFTVTARHSAQSTANAYEFSFTDNLPENLGPVAIVSATVDGQDVSDQLVFDPVTGILTGTDIDIPLGATFTLVYQIVVLDTAGPNQTISNTVMGTWTSLDGDQNPGAEDGERDGSQTPELNDYFTQAEDQVVTDALLEIEKSVADPDTEYAVGETVTYNLDVTVMEGTLQNVVITDVLAPGLRLDLDSLTVVDIGFAGGPVTIVNATASINAAGYTVLVLELDNDAAAGNQIVNPGDNVDGNNTFRISFQAVVTNVLDNQDGTILTNVAAVDADDTALDVATEDVTVVEPELTADKTVLPYPDTIDAGDEATYQVVLTNTGTSTAYDIELTDVAPPNTTFVPGSITVTDENGTVSATITLSPDNSTLTISGFDLAVDASVTINYNLLLGDDVQPGDVLVNDMEATWTSTPGANDDERTGADGPGPDDSVLDNYAVEDSDAITVGELFITVEKTVVDSSVDATQGEDVAVGEIVTYRVRVGINEGTSRQLALEDVLPDGQRYIPGSVVVVPGGDGWSLNYSEAVVDGNILRVSDISVTNPGDNDPDNDYIDIFYQVVIENDPSIVVDGQNQTNTVTITTSDTDFTGSATVTVVEPDLVIDKSVDEEFVPLGGSAGYTITVEHSADSSADAFDVVIEDPFDDPFMVLDPATITAEIVGAPAGTPDPVVQLVDSGFRITAEVLPVGASIVIHFNAEAVVEDAANGASSPNTVSLSYDTIPGTDDPDEQRTYTGDDDATITIAGPDLQVIKDASQGIVEVGGLYSYTIQVLNKGAPGVDAGDIEQATNVVLTDTLPEDIELLGVTVDGVSVPFTVDPVTRQFAIQLGTLVPEQTATIVLTVQLADVLSPVTEPGERDFLVNTATATLDEPDPTPEDNTDTAIIVPIDDGRPPAPDLVIEKTNAVEETGGSETVPFTITARNVGSRVAADVQIVDRIDTRVFEFVSASNGGVYDASSGTVTWHLDTLSPDDGDQTFTLVLRVKPGLSASVDETTNVVRIQDNGLGGRDPTPENNVARHTDGLIYPDLVITKMSEVEEVAPGDVIDYVITIRNIGDFRADGVQVRDYIDPRIFRFVSATHGGTFDPRTNIVTWNLGTVAPGQSAITLGLKLEVLFPSQAGLDQAVNVIEVDSDGSTGLDSDPSNNTATEIDILNALPDPTEIAWVLGDDEEEEEEEIEEFLYVSPIFTGTAAIGATVTVTLYGPDGLPLDTGSVVSGPDGNWILSMRDIEGPAPLSAIVTTSPPTLTPLGALDHTNVYFNPGGNSPIDFHRDFDIYSAQDHGADIVLKDMMTVSEDPLAVSSRRYVNYHAITGTAISDY